MLSDQQCGQQIDNLLRYQYSQIYAMNNTQIDYINKIMKQSHAIGKPSPSFLDKFKGKQSVLSKEGLLNLFEKKKQQLQVKANHPSTSSKPQKLGSIKIKLKQLDKLKNNQIQKRDKMKSVDSISRSVQMQNGSKILPSLQKSISHTQPLHKKQVQFGQKDVIRTSNSVHGINKSKQKQRDFQQKFQLDKYAINHLQFLNKFEQKILMKEKRSEKQKI